MTRPVDPQRRSMPLPEWPDADRLAWERALLPADPFDLRVGYATRWKPSTCALIIAGYGHWLSWLTLRGELCDGDPARRVTPDRARAYLADLKALGLADHTLKGRIAQLGDAMRALAPDRDWHWIGRAAARIGARAVPVRDVNSRMQPPEAILDLGLDMMQAAEHDRFRTDRERATLYRDGLLIALMVMRPMRIQNMASLVIGRTLERRGEHWWLNFRVEEVKGAEALDAQWPVLLAGPLARYMEVHRPVLLKSASCPDPGCSDLWISRRGGGMTVDAVAVQVCARTEEEFGQAINPHTFRHIGATTIASETPENVTDIAGVLGHVSLTVSEKHYTKVRTLMAGRAYQAVILAQRRELGGRALAPGRDGARVGGRSGERPCVGAKDPERS